MRTYKLIGYVIVIYLQLSKVYASNHQDTLFFDDPGSGDGDEEHVVAKYPPDEEVGSGWKPDHTGVADVDAEDDYGDYYYDYKVEGSGFYPTNIDEPPPIEVPVGRNPEFNYDDDFRIPPELPNEDIFEEIPVDSNKSPSLEESPKRMPSSTPPPTLTDTHTDMDNSIRILTQKDDERQVSIFAQPGILAAFIGGAVMGLLCAILLVMFIVYRMRKRDEGSYPLDEPKRVPLTSSYAPNDKEIYA